MNNKLLIIGASTYGVISFEIASDMGCFGKIDFIDDKRTVTPNGIKVIGKTENLENIVGEYGNVFVAIGDNEARAKITQRLRSLPSVNIVSLISPRSFVSKTAKINTGCAIEPMAVVHAGCVLLEGCIISAGAVINHGGMCGEFAHVDCNATVEGFCNVPSLAKVKCGEIFNEKDDKLLERFLANGN